jgi:hypothetical protein
LKQSNKVGANENIDLFVLKPNFTFKVADGGAIIRILYVGVGEEWGVCASGEVVGVDGH